MMVSSLIQAAASKLKEQSQSADSDTVSTYQVSSVQLVTNKISAAYWSPTALKRPDRSKQCHCLQFAKCIPGLLHYYTVTILS